MDTRLHPVQVLQQWGAEGFTSAASVSAEQRSSRYELRHTRRLLRGALVKIKSLFQTSPIAPDMSHELENTMQCIRTPNITYIHTYRSIRSHLVWEAALTHVRAISCVRWLATERTRLPTRPSYIPGPCPSRLQLAEAAFRLPVALQAVPRPSCTSASLSPRDHLAGVQRGGMSGTHQHHPAPKARPPTSQQINEVDAYAVTSHRIWSSCTRMASRCSAP